MLTNVKGYQEVEPEFLDMMKTSIRVSPVSTTDPYGKRTYGAPEEIPCHMVHQVEKAVAQDGEVWVISGRAYLGWVVPWLTVRDKYEVRNLAGEWEQATVGIVNVQEGPDGPHHQEVFFGKRGVQGDRLE